MILINLERLISRNFREDNDFSWFRQKCVGLLLLSKAIKLRAGSMSSERGLVCPSG
jgi:hypothetical protein